MLMSYTNRSCDCVVGEVGQQPQCPPILGSKPTQLPQLGNNSASFMVTYQFNCSGYITELWYYSGARNALVYVGIWRQLAQNVYELKKKIPLTPDSVGLHRVSYSPAIEVERGDFIGIHHSRFASSQGVVPFATEDDSVQTDLYRTVLADVYDEELQEGQSITLYDEDTSVTNKAYAIQFYLDYKGNERKPKANVSALLEHVVVVFVALLRTQMSFHSTSA